MSTFYDLEFHIDEDWLIDLSLEDGDGDPIDLSGSPTLRFRLSTLAGTTVMTRTEADGITVTSGTDGECTLWVTPAHQTSASVTASTRYQWELRSVASGVTSVQARGHLTVLPSLLAD